MHEFDHPNVLKLVGVCLDGGPAPYIVMPFMANGSLSSYLKEERETLLLDPASTNQDDVVKLIQFGFVCFHDCMHFQAIIEKKLLDFCIQVAKGMEYLISKRVIHRDLAERNCM